MSELYVIETGIAIPEKTRGLGSKPKYPYQQMQVGESMLATRSAVSAAVAWGRRSGSAEYTSRKTNTPGVIRLWRVK